jgi:hypothetical protein
MIKEGLLSNKAMLFWAPLSFVTSIVGTSLLLFRPLFRLRVWAGRVDISYCGVVCSDLRWNYRKYRKNRLRRQLLLLMILSLAHKKCDAKWSPAYKQSQANFSVDLSAL